MAFVIVLEKDRMRSSVEDAIRMVYRDHYGARLACFPEVLVAEITPWGTIECAAGLRFGYQRLFLEYYLDNPLELTLERRFGRRIDRHRAVEICHLVASAPGSSLPFVHRIVEYVESAGAEWAVFTATKPLRVLLRKERLKMVELAPAEQTRVPNPTVWGTYFEHDPRVMAVNRFAVFESARLRAEPARLGVAALA